jgi:3-oxoacyl-[acyl-carrier protein] reductase
VTPGDRAPGRVALVTGASRGIGLAIARRLIDDGARVCITARKQEELDAAVASLPAGKAIGVSGNVADADHLHDTLERIATELGALDVFVSATGINPAYGPLIDADDARIAKTVDVNVLAPVRWIRALAHHPLHRFTERGGDIVFVSSFTGTTPSPNIGFYGVTKAAVDQLTRTLAVELAPAIRVNAVAPAVVRTSFSRALYESDEANVIARYPLGRLGEPEDVAAAVSYFTSADAAWVTGQILTLDGGLRAAGGVA